MKYFVYGNTDFGEYEFEHDTLEEAEECATYMINEGNSAVIEDENGKKY